METKNAYTAAMAKIADDPSLTTLATDCSDLTAAGYTESTGATCSLGFTDVDTFSITITGDTAWGLTGNTAVIDAGGVLTKASP